MRLLLLLPFPPRLDATHGSGRVLSQFLTEITTRHTVAIACLRDPREPGVDDFLRERCKLVEEVVRVPPGESAGGRLGRYLQLMTSLFRLRPIWVSDWASRSFALRARSVIRDFRPDVIQAESHVMGQYFSSLHNNCAPCLLVEYEPGVRSAPYLGTLPPIFARLIHGIERLSWRRYEAGLFRRVNAIVVFTQADRQAIRKLAGSTPIRVIPPGIGIPDRPLSPLGTCPPSILFVGSFIHPPNVDAAKRLIQTIFPLIQQHIPEVQLLIVGDSPPPEIRLHSRGNVLVTGRVPDVTPYLDRAALFVAPLHLGGGIRIKILEALAAGKAVVTTPLGTQGLDLVDGVHVSLAESDTEFAERILELLGDPEKCTFLAQSARAWGCDHLGWDRSLQSYEMLYSELIDEPDQAKINGEGRKSDRADPQ